MHYKEILLVPAEKPSSECRQNGIYPPKLPFATHLQEARPLSPRFPLLLYVTIFKTALKT